MKVYVIQSKSGIIMSISLNVKNKMNGVLIKMTLCGSTCTYDCKCNKVCRIDEYLDTKMCLTVKEVLSWEDEILNTSEASLDYKKVKYKSNNCLIHTISLIIKCFLLLVVLSISCYYYFSKNWIKEGYAVLY